ncbi:acetylglutamate kinase [Planctomycetota bacterium]
MANKVTLKETIVVRVGGAEVMDPMDLRRLSARVRCYLKNNKRAVIVHGGDLEVRDLHRALHVPYGKRRGLRATSEASMAIVTMVLCGLVNTRLVAQFNADGIPSIGLSGIDLSLMQSDFLNAEDLGRTGGPPRVSHRWLEHLLAQGVTPILAPVCLASDGQPINVDPDTVANAVAAALCASALELVCRVPELMPPDGVADRIEASEIPRLIREGFARGDMVRKLQAASAALAGSVNTVRIGDLHDLSRDEATVVRRT